MKVINMKDRPRIKEYEFYFDEQTYKDFLENENEIRYLEDTFSYQLEKDYKNIIEVDYNEYSLGFRITVQVASNSEEEEQILLKYITDFIENWELQDFESLNEKE